MEGLRQRHSARTAPGEAPVEQAVSEDDHTNRNRNNNNNNNTPADDSFRNSKALHGHSSDEENEDLLNESNDASIDEAETEAETETTASAEGRGGPRSAMSATAVQKDESKLRKIVVRVNFGAGMFAVFCGLVYMGHTYICALIAVIEMLVFRELVRVRYSAYYERIQDTIPLFRTTQWLWFAVAIFYTYGAFLSEILQKNQSLHYLLKYMQYFPSISFLLYSGTFVLTISTLQRGTVKFQLNQLCWTVLVIMLTVGQLKYIMHNIFNGLFWFVLPCCLVFANDIMAYVSGMAWGRKFIRRPFIAFSPNKTWEGFIGGWFFTMIAAWHVSRFLAQYTWMTCPTNEFRFFHPEPLECELDPIFLPAQSSFSPQMFELFPNHFVKLIFPKAVEICSVKSSALGDSFLTSGNDALQLTPCVSGVGNHVHHHFELTIHNYYPIQIHALWLALFASLVAPFGGFFASAIKRAYGIKDFDSIIPGHGGVMDRMDCQFLMALCTWVHYNTFIRFSTISVPKLTYMYSLLTEQEKIEFLESISATMAGRNNKINLLEVLRIEK